jgi:hypothetical protein
MHNKMNNLSDGNPLPYHIPDDLVDDMTNDHQNYSWLNDPAVAQSRLPLMKHVLSSSDFDIQFIDHSGNMHFKQPGMIQFLQFTAEINRLLSVLNHMVPSQPSRGTEDVDIRIRNGHRHRNIFHTHGQYWTVMQYSKTENVTGHNSWIPILYPDEIAHLNEYYLIHIRPLEIFFAEQLYGEEAKLLYQEFLYVQNGKHITSDQFSTHLSMVTAKYCGVALRIRAWRHIAIALKRAFISPSLINPFQPHNDTGDLATGHGTHQARRTYAVDQDSLPFLSSDAMLEFGDFCTVWQSVLGFGPLPIPTTLRQQASLLRGQVGAQTLPILPAATATTTLVDPTTGIKEAITNAMNPIVDSLKTEMQLFQGRMSMALEKLTSSLWTGNQVTKTVGMQDDDRPGQHHDYSPSGSFMIPLQPQSQHTDTNIISLNSPSPPPPPPASQPLATDAQLCNEQLEGLLKQLYKDPLAEFRSPAQHDMAKVVIEAREDLLVVLPTGAGKSLAWELPAMGYIQGHMAGLIIVIIPFVAIINDAQARAHSRGISSAKFSPKEYSSGKMRNIKDIQILFVSVESTCNAAFRQ